MEQVKHFLYEIKEAYDADRLEWNLAKEEFRYQLELKENLWIEANMRLNQIIEVVNISNVFLLYELSNCKTR